MTTLPSSGYPSNSVRTKGEMKTFFENVLSGIKEIVGRSSTVAKPMASNSFTPSTDASTYVLTGEGGVADQLDSINPANLSDGQVIRICIASASAPITVNDSYGGGNEIKTFYGDDPILNATNQFMDFKYESAGGGTLREVYRSQNIDFANQAANLIYAGPTTGAAAKPSFRNLVAADLDANNLMTRIQGWTGASTLTISASDVITPLATSGHVLKLSANTGTSDSVNFLDYTNFPDGAFARLIATATHTITLKHAAGGAGANQAAFSLPGSVDFVLNGNTSLLVYRDGTTIKAASPGGVAVIDAPFQARLTWQSGQAAPPPSLEAGTLTKAQGSTTVYLTPYAGNWVKTFDGAKWNSWKLASELSIAVPNWLNAFVCADVWLRDDTHQLELTAWSTPVGVSASPAAGANKTVTLASTAGFAAGDFIVFHQNSTSSALYHYARVVSITNGTQLVVDWHNGTAYSYAYKPGRDGSYTLQAQDGCLVKSTDTTRLYVGTIMGCGVNASNNNIVSNADFLGGGNGASHIAAIQGIKNFFNRIPLRLCSIGAVSGSATNPTVINIWERANDIAPIIGIAANAGDDHMLCDWIAQYESPAAAVRASIMIGVNMSCAAQGANAFTAFSYTNGVQGSTIGGLASSDGVLHAISRIVPQTATNGAGQQDYGIGARQFMPLISASALTMGFWFNNSHVTTGANQYGGGMFLETTW